MKRSRRGSLVVVGMGPGDPELVTLKALRVIQAADVIIAPVRRISQQSVALGIARSVVDLTGRETMTVVFPSERDDGGWNAVANTVAERLSDGRRGVFVTEGDPTLFSTCGHLLAAMAKVAPHLELSIVPGVSSVTAGAAAARVSLGLRDSTVAVVSATAPDEALDRELAGSDTVVILKVGTAMTRVLDALDRNGRAREAVYVRRCSRPDESVVRDVALLRTKAPDDYWSLIIVQSGAL